MNTQIESKPVVIAMEMVEKVENPMQERHIGEITESFELTAEAVFAARRLESREEAGPLFVP